jgi:ribonuclease BN (tRNA processing enzyme)
MKIQFLGTGSAFTLKNFQTNMLVQKNGKNLLIDAGGDIRFSLKEVNLSYKDINSLYISHLHADHAGGVEYLGFCTYFDPSCKEKIQLFGNGELLRKGWNDTWKGGMESIQGELLSLDSFFDVNMIRPNGKFIWEEIEFTIVQSIHIMNGYVIVPCYGLLAKDISPAVKDAKQPIVYFTTDVQFCPNQIMDFYKMADVIIQDCETLPFKSGVHANYSELRTLPEDIKKKMLLVHYQDNVFSEDGEISMEWEDKLAQDKLRFAGKFTAFNALGKGTESENGKALD